MNGYLPIIITAPGAAREQLRRSDVLPQHLFRDIVSEPLWEEHSAPAIYLWPYDIPYSRSEEFREITKEHVGDVPAFFGMDRMEKKDHQERLLSQVLFGSVVVHIVFLSSPNSKARNSDYAQFCTFDEMIDWGLNLKKTMDFRFLNHHSQSRNILAVIAPDGQVRVTQEKIDTLNSLIGESKDGSYKPFLACYFLDYNLKPQEREGAGRNVIIHSKFTWDVLVGRFLLALLLSQEKCAGEADCPKLWDTPGVKVWRALDCTISVEQDSSQDVLKKAMRDAAQKLQELCCKDPEAKYLSLLKTPSVDRISLNYELDPRWRKNELKLFESWSAKRKAGWTVSQLSESLVSKWSVLPVSSYNEEIRSKEHWQESFAELSRQRISWMPKPEDYTTAVENFFLQVRKKPGTLGDFIGKLFDKMAVTYNQLKENHSDPWAEIVAAEKKRQQTLKQLAEDSKEFQKAQDHYVGRGIGLIVMAAVTTFLGWMIWQVLSLFGVGIMKILMLSGFVFTGALAAYIAVMILHNFTGNRAAVKIMSECLEAEQAMLTRDDRVRKMFFEGIDKRNILTLQCVRFRTWLLAQRVLSILQTELQPQLSSLLEIGVNTAHEKPSPDSADADHVRDTYLKLTRSTIGPIKITNNSHKKDDLDQYLTRENNPDSFINLWNEKWCSEDKLTAGYFPARVFIFGIRSFVTSFLEEIHHRLLETSLQQSDEKIVKAPLEEFTRRAHKIQEDGFLLSVPLPSGYIGSQTSILFINSSFYAYRLKGGLTNTANFTEHKSKLLETTRTAALFYEEVPVDIQLGPNPNSEEKDSGLLTFKPKLKRGRGE